MYFALNLFFPLLLYCSMLVYCAPELYMASEFRLWPANIVRLLMWEKYRTEAAAYRAGGQGGGGGL